MLTVVGHKKSRTFRVLWALEEMQINYEFSQHSPRSSEVVALNPLGKVPVLLDGEAAITDSTAIITYLADKFGKLTAPAGTIERAHQDAMTQFLLDEFDACLWMAARHSFVLPEDRRMPEIKASLRWEFSRSQKEFVRRLGDGPFAVGAQMTIADIIATHCGTWAHNAKFDISEPAFEDYIDRMIAREAWQKVTNS